MALVCLGPERCRRGLAAFGAWIPGTFRGCFLAHCYGEPGALERDTNVAPVERLLDLDIPTMWAVIQAAERSPLRFRKLLARYCESEANTAGRTGL